MRQGQNNAKRSRGRGRKPQGSSSNRAFDSNGPDMKIRGTATHICEKYQQLARDAISVGDRVMAENYYQHAEHYYRLIMAAQVGQEGQARPQNNLGYRPQDDDEDFDDDDTQDNNDQPRHPGQPYHENAGQNSDNGNERGNGRNNRNDRNDRNDRGNGGQRPHRSENQNDQPEGSEIRESVAQAETTGEQGEEAPAPRRRQNRRRRPRSEAGADDAPQQASDSAGEGVSDAPVKKEAPAKKEAAASKAEAAPATEKSDNIPVV